MGSNPISSWKIRHWPKGPYAALFASEAASGWSLRAGDDKTSM
ncbi:MAG TPA: hypothetical protein PKY88_00410 [Anaerohalosphaeraceae bacterium]|nr:hypothetical protein [Anaerohalosphaeraceae bacterium]